MPAGVDGSRPGLCHVHLGHRRRRRRTLVEEHYARGVAPSHHGDGLPGHADAHLRAGQRRSRLGIWCAPSNGWSGWYSLGGWIDLIKVATNQDGRLEIFARGGDGARARRSLGSWAWRRFFWLLSSVAGLLLDVVKNADGRLEVFVARHRQRPVAHVADGAEQRLVGLGQSSAGCHRHRSPPPTPTAGWKCSSAAPTTPCGTCGRRRPTTAGRAGPSSAASSPATSPWAATPTAGSNFSSAAPTSPVAYVADGAQQRLERLVLAWRLDRSAGHRQEIQCAPRRSSRAAATVPSRICGRPRPATAGAAGTRFFLDSFLKVASNDDGRMEDAARGRRRYRAGICGRPRRATARAAPLHSAAGSISWKCGRRLPVTRRRVGRTRYRVCCIA